MEEIKDFFVRNCTLTNKRFYTIQIKDYKFSLGKESFFLWIDKQINQNVIVENITLDRLKALIYGLTGKNLD